MPCTLLIRGGEIELHPSEKFNKIRHRANKAQKMVIDYQNGNIDGVSKDQKFQPAHVLTFRTADMEDEDGPGGRISILVENYIGIMSSDPKDVGGGGGNDEDYEDEGEEDDE